MKTKILKPRIKEQLALPGNPITLERFKSEIKKAEKDSFYTVEESKKLLEEWRKHGSFR